MIYAGLVCVPRNVEAGTRKDHSLTSQLQGGGAGLAFLIEIRQGLSMLPKEQTAGVAWSHFREREQKGSMI